MSLQQVGTEQKEHTVLVKLFGHPYALYSRRSVEELRCCVCVLWNYYRFFGFLQCKRIV